MDSNTSSQYREAPWLIGRECLGFNVRKAARVLAKAYDEALAPIDLKMTQFSVMVSLRIKGPVSMRECAELLKMDRTTLTRNLKPLLRRGLLKLAVGEDRRSRLIALTGAGEELLAKAVPLWEGIQRRLVSEMGAEEAGSLRASLTSLCRIAEG